MLLFFFLALFFYFRFQLNPRLYDLNQETIFFTGSSFFREQMSAPGGPMVYAAAFASQFFIFPEIGALLLVVLFFLLSLGTRRMLQSTGAPEIPFLYLLPLVLLLILHNNYAHELSTTMGVILSVYFYCIYTKISIQDVKIRILGTVLLSVLLYILTAGPFLLFAGLVIILEAARRNFFIPALMLALALLLPWIASKILYLYSVKSACLAVLPFAEHYRPAFAPYAFYLLFPSLLIFSLAYRHFYANSGSGSVKVRKIFLLHYALIILVTAGAAVLSFDRFNRAMLQMSDDVRRDKWHSVIADARSQELVSKHFFHYYYRALYHTNRLPYDFFAFTYPEGIEDMLFSESIGFYTPWVYSDFFYDIGLLNESQHWAFEALTIQGPTVWVLQRLTLINILKGEKSAAAKFLGHLEKTLFYKGWARHYREVLDNPSMIDQDPVLYRARMNSSQQDFITHNKDPYSAVESLFLRNKDNKMAFEYLCVYDLVSGRLESFADRLRFIDNFGYRDFPRLFEEGLLLYMYTKKLEKFDLGRKQINRNTYNRFMDFQQTYARYRGDKNAAFKEMEAKFGPTYWFYMVFQGPGSKSSAQEPGGAK